MSLTAILRFMLAASAMAVSVVLSGCAGTVTPDAFSHIKLPPGFSISIYARVPGAHSMVPVPELGAVFVGTRDDTLYGAFDRDFDMRAEHVQVLSRRLNVPYGIAWREGWLYVAEQHRIFRYQPEPARLAPQKKHILYDRLPDMGYHS